MNKRKEIAPPPPSSLSGSAGESGAVFSGSGAIEWKDAVAAKTQAGVPESVRGSPRILVAAGGGGFISIYRGIMIFVPFSHSFINFPILSPYEDPTRLVYTQPRHFWRKPRRARAAQSRGRMKGLMAARF